MLIKCKKNVGHVFVILLKSKILKLKDADINILYTFLNFFQLFFRNGLDFHSNTGKILVIIRIIVKIIKRFNFFCFL
jgi:hypothetical protein